MKTGTAPERPEPAAVFYVHTLHMLRDTGIPFLVGGRLAFSHYSHIPRNVKDIDVFVKPQDCPRVLAAFAQAGYQTDLTFPHWLGKVWHGAHVMDVIFGSGNGVARVDDLWFEHAPTADVLGVTVRLTPAEELLWSKAFVQERERFDGADVIHILHGMGPSLDWPRLLMRFGDHWRVLLSHLILFGFVYPDKRQTVPAWVMDELVHRLSASPPPSTSHVCYGPLLSREQYLPDLERFGYLDSRAAPSGSMTAREIDIWTAAIARPERP
jgi:hypothetical protein